MPRRALLIALLALAGCKDDKKQQAAGKAAPDAAPRAPDAAAAQGPMIAPAPAPSAATAEGCKTTAPYTTKTMRLAAEARQVPAENLDAVAAELSAAFLEQCSASQWPAHFLACLDRAPQDLAAYRRCFERLPAARRTAWNARLDEIIGPAGGQTYPAPARQGAEGLPFEEVCPAFVAEVARLDTCTGAQYMPVLEEVYARARAVTVDDVIPTAEQATLKALCDERTVTAREAATAFCKGQ